MAGKRVRTTKVGTQSYQIYWSTTGSRSPNAFETFATEKAADDFRADVEKAGNQWPTDWVKGVGYVTGSTAATEATENNTDLMVVAEKWIGTLLKCQGDTKTRYRTIVRDSLYPFFPTLQDITEQRIFDWMDHRRKFVGNGAKTLRNHHAVIFSLCAFGIRRYGLTENPCLVTGKELPDPDDERQGEEVTCVLEHDEWELFYNCTAVVRARDLFLFTVATGLRFGEVTALQVRECYLNDRKTGEPLAEPYIRITRAWKKNEEGDRVMGPPKTKAGRRNVTLDPDTANLLRRIIGNRTGKAFVFATEDGNSLTHSLVYDNWWLPTVARARKAGLDKEPRFHDLRHTHASWLLDANVPVTVVAERLGHDSTLTTTKTYGHRMRRAQSVVWAAIQGALGPAASAPSAPADPAGAAA